MNIQWIVHWTRDQWETLFESLSEGLVIQDLSGRIVAANSAAERILGLSFAQMQGRTSVDPRWQAVHEDGSPFPGETHPAMETLRTGRVVEGVLLGLEVPGEGRRWIRATAVPLRNRDDQPFEAVVTTFLDVTEVRARNEERLRLQEQLNQNQRFEALGFLAAGIAHDFNNLLGAFSANLEVMRMHLDRGATDRVRGPLDKARASLIRAQALSNQLLTFAKGGAPEVGPVALGEFLREVVAFALSGSPVTVEWDEAPGLAPASLDRLQMAQVVDNLVINALQAMAGGGRLTLRLRPWAGNPEFLLEVQVEDQGPGIAPDQREAVFQPFFTTKPEGSGLGLAMARSIARRHGGDLVLIDGAGTGACFQLLVPVADGVPPPAPAPEGEARYRGRVYVLDDEAGLRDALAELLGQMGFEVEAGDDPEAAVAALTALTAGPPGAWTLAILDLTLPGPVGGVEVARRLREAGLRLPLIAFSGYSAGSVLGRAPAFGFNASLHKPFQVGDLVRALDQAAPGARILDEGAGS